MKRKCFILILALLMIGLLSYFSNVRAAQVTDRELAISAAYSYMPWFQKGKKITEGFDIGKFKGISTIANGINSKFNLHNYATAQELDDWLVDDFNGLKALTQNGLNVLRLKKGNDIIIAITGSFSPVDAFEDIKYGLKNYTNQEKHLRKYIDKTLEEYSKKESTYNFYITGHSLGGYLTQIAADELSDYIEENNCANINLVRVVSFNGMGMNFLTALGEKYNYGSHQDTIETLKELGQQGKLINYYVYGDVVSALGVNYGEMRMLLPSIDSIAYHRTNYSILGSFGNKLVKAAEKQTAFNAFKTDLSGAEQLYKVNNIAAYLNLTHEADHFVTLNPETSTNKPNVKIIENKNVLSSHITKAQEHLNITKSITLKALTEFASTKKYVWSVSTDKKSWKVIKTVDLYNLNGQIATNTLNVNINSIPTGETRYYKVDAYYDDNYITSVYNYNEEIHQYEYVETDTSKQTQARKVSSIIEITHTGKTQSKLLSKLKNLFKN